MIGNHEIHAALHAAAKAAWYAGRGRLDHDDCVSEANEAVAQAMRTYDASRGCSLSRYASNRARWQALNLLRRKARNIPLPTEWFDKVPIWPHAALAEMFEGTELRVVSLWLDHGLTYREIADQTDMTVFGVFGIMQRVQKKLLKWACTAT
jgi:DNA-directed RNA polymerase specialized sigma24 family protein